MGQALSDRKHPVHMPNVRRHNEPVIVFVTVCTAQRRGILANHRAHLLLAQAWNLSADWTVGRYIVMPDHVHLFCSPADMDAKGVGAWASYWKSLVSRALQGFGPLAKAEMDGVEAVPPCSATCVLGIDHTNPVERKCPVWQRDIWDTQMRSGRLYHEKWDYVRMNPVRKGLVNDPDLWPFQGELNQFLW